ncbi:glycoprotein-N-acetylgalactosamine 3-beta-galactosyltransferase 1-like [Mizuhopecten yessoensis]|uniref:glycoprotein-N-acetylgalactosamine 3-beta-galactosyltransferase 1-like n=1 Tax=Mizuhopecten yessoensis TaxID=6573 RepID=UPI000B45CB16|nr:glycoprotein-N-acetylgalactosamine 3-beta-galactosyltransferase 1-like [Mizuhopecten yessoensis]
MSNSKKEMDTNLSGVSNLFYGLNTDVKNNSKDVSDLKKKVSVVKESINSLPPPDNSGENLRMELTDLKCRLMRQNLLFYGIPEDEEEEEEEDSDDDTYVILENLRNFLRDKDQNEAIYFGRRFKPFVKQGFMSGGAGYVLSRQAVRSLVQYGNSTTSYLNSKCEPTTFIGEDVQLGQCLEMVGVKAGDTRDSEGKERFFPLRPEDHIVRGNIPKNSWYWSHIYYPHLQGCSRTAISFHYITPNMMYAMDYFVYNLTR